MCNTIYIGTESRHGNQMYSSTTMIREAEALDFDPSALDFAINVRDVDDYDNYSVLKTDVAVFAFWAETPTLEMFEKLVQAQKDGDSLYDEFVRFCMEED